jgi:hypothetical protein
MTALMCQPSAARAAEGGYQAAIKVTMKIDMAKMMPNMPPGWSVTGSSRRKVE